MRESTGSNTAIDNLMLEQACTLMPHAQEFRKTFEPHACELHSFNASHFSQCVAGQRIIIIGDSTMRQVFQSLACLLHAEVTGGFFMVRS